MRVSRVGEVFTVRDRENGSEGSWAALDRHALVLAIWFPAGFVGALLMLHGYLLTAPWIVFGGFGAALAGFAGHVVVNAVYRTPFTVYERALGIVVYGVGLVWFLIALLLAVGQAGQLFVPFSLGFLAVLTGVVFYMLTSYGTRGAFDAFDVIREFKP